MNNLLLILIAAAAGFCSTALLGFLFIPWLHKLYFGQTIPDMGRGWQKYRQGTPAMGGIMLAIGTLAAITAGAATAKMTGIDIAAGNSIVPAEMKTKFWSGILMAVSFALVGFTDDYIKAVKKQSPGLTINQKTLMQLLIILAYLSSLQMGMGGSPHMFIPFAGSINMGLFYWFFGICFILGTVNAVKQTDGVDGLSPSIAFTVAVTLGIIAAMRGLLGISLAGAALAGGCGGFLIWNRRPAKATMGDTGSLFLGGMAAALAYALGCPVILLPVGLIYLIEAVPAIFQCARIKTVKGTGLLKTAPAHRYFEKTGWGTKKIVTVFTLVNTAGCAAGVLLMHYGGY